MLLKINKQAIGISKKYLKRHAVGMVRPVNRLFGYLLGTSMIQRWFFLKFRELRKIYKIIL